MLEGLGYSRLPCARGLSVAGLLTVLGRFLGPGRFILRVKREVLPEQEPSTNSETGITV